MNDDTVTYHISDKFISILSGILFGLIIYRGILCPRLFHGPDSRDIVNKIFKVNEKYYELEPIICRR